MLDWNLLLWSGLYAFAIIVVGYVLSGWLATLTSLALERTRLDPIVRRLVVSVVRPVVMALAVFGALSIVGIPMTTFAAMAGAITLAVGMSMQGSLSNVASGAMLLSLRPFNVDDTITAGGHTGKVRALKLFCTVVDTPAGNTITLPNDVVFKGPITTYTKTPTCRIELSYTVEPGADIDKTAKIIRDALTKDERTHDEPGVSIVFQGTNDIGIVIEGRAWVNNEHKWDALSDNQHIILKALQKASIPIATRKA